MRKPLIHIIFWIAFFFTWYRVVYFYIDNPINGLYFTAFDVSLIIIGFYLVFSVIMPLYFKGKRTGLLLFSVVALTIALSLIYFGLMTAMLRHSVMPIHFDFSWTYLDLQENKIFIALLGTGAGAIVKLALDRMESNKRLEQMEKERSVAELTYLKAQINPHFLFNSLNSLYAQLEAGSKDTKGTLAALADLLRFQLYDCDADFIPLKKEIEYLQNYFTLQSIRKENCRLEFVVDDMPDGLMIAPLLLVPFLENAFKYVSDYDGSANFIRAGLKLSGNELHFYCMNTTQEKAFGNETGKGIGISNVIKRLQLIYADRYWLTSGLNDKIFEVDMKIRLK